MERIAIYLRLSKEDEGDRDESNSISNQRQLILDYIRRDKKLRKLECIELKDDGYSGKNLNRPGVQKLLELVRKQQISVVIVKDMSRLSRDYLVLGQYTEQIFPFLGVRFIAINDSYDSSLCEGGVGEIDVAFKALLYDFYSEDISQKIKASFSVRKASGKFMQVYAPYGYRKSPADHNILEIEPEGAEVIRRIYRDYAAGKSMNRIVLELNQDKVKTPGAYINDRDNRDYFRNSPKKDSWSTVMVSRILNNEIYGGTLVWHKYHSDATGNAHGGIPYPKDTWERVENAQPALIDEETFLAVRKKLESNSRPKTVHEPHILKGKIYCGNCGYAMGHTYAGRHSYGCYRKYTRTDKDNCVTSIHDSVLEEILLTLIREKMKNRIGMKEIIAGETEARKIKLKTAKSHLKDMELSYEKIDADLFHAYEAYREGISNKETYLQQKEVYEQMLSQMKENMDRQQAAVSAIEEESGIPEGWIKDCEFLEVEKFDRTLVELLIQKVIVSADCGIEVIWNFEN